MEQPPFTITPRILSLLAEIAEVIGRLGISDEAPFNPHDRPSQIIFHSLLAGANLQSHGSLVHGEIPQPKTVLKAQNKIS